MFLHTLCGGNHQLLDPYSLRAETGGSRKWPSTARAGLLGQPDTINSTNNAGGGITKDILM